MRQAIKFFLLALFMLAKCCSSILLFNQLGVTSELEMKRVIFFASDPESDPESVHIVEPFSFTPTSDRFDCLEFTFNILLRACALKSPVDNILLEFLSDTLLPNCNFILIITKNSCYIANVFDSNLKHFTFDENKFKIDNIFNRGMYMTRLSCCHLTFDENKWQIDNIVNRGMHMKRLSCLQDYIATNQCTINNINMSIITDTDHSDDKKVECDPLERFVDCECPDVCGTSQRAIIQTIKPQNNPPGCCVR